VMTGRSSLPVLVLQFPPDSHAAMAAQFTRPEEAGAGAACTG
jgi:hypothetical protein